MSCQDLGEDGPIQLVHGHLGDPMGRSGNMLGPQFDQSAIQEVFTDHDAEMLIVHPDLEARASGWRRPTANAVPAATSAAQLDREPAHARTIAGESRLASDIAAAPRVGNAQRGAEAVRVPVYWQVSLPTAKNICSVTIFARNKLLIIRTSARTLAVSFCVNHWRVVVRQSNDEHNRRGDLAIYQEDTVGDVRARIVSVRVSALLCYPCSLLLRLIDAI